MNDMVRRAVDRRRHPRAQTTITVAPAAGKYVDRGRGDRVTLPTLLTYS